MSRKKRRHTANLHKFLLIALLKEGPLSLKGLDRITSRLIAQFEIVGGEFWTRIISGVLSRFGRPAAIRSRRSKREDDPEVDIPAECKELLTQDLIKLNDKGLYELTEKGEEQARQFETNLKKNVILLEKQIFSPTATARNTFLIDFFLAALKLSTGFLSGSVGLIADGGDATIDTVSALIVWLGMKIKRELLGAILVLLMMFTTGISIGYESITSILEALKGTLPPISGPYLVIIAEAIALIFGIILFIYQRFVGKRNGSLALISQSIDSKNHIYVAIAVIAGAIFSIFGIHFFDALIGGFIAVRILIDGIELSKETVSSLKGEEIDLEKYEMPLEKQWQTSRIETFRVWILFYIEEQITRRAELIKELEHTFKPKYTPILSEFKFSLGKGFNFEEAFESLINPLLEENLITKKNEEYTITEEGRKRISGLTRRGRFTRAY